MREQWIVRLPSIEEEAPPEIPALAMGDQIRIEPVQQTRPPRGLRLSETEFAHFRFLEQIVPEEQFVGSLASKDDLDSRFLGQLRQQIHRDGRGAQQRSLGVPDDAGEGLRDAVRTNRCNQVPASDIARYLALKLSFIEARIIERDRKGAQLERRRFRRKRGSN